MTTTYESKVDGWLLAVLGGAVAVSVYTCADLLQDGSSTAYLLLPALLLIGVVLPVWVLRATRYVLSDEELTVRSGPFVWRVPPQEIRSITPSRSLASAPALSLDRLRIDYGAANALLISPRDQAAFLQQLALLRAGTAPAAGR